MAPNSNMPLYYTQLHFWLIMFVTYQSAAENEPDFFTAKITFLLVKTFYITTTA